MFSLKEIKRQVMSVDPYDNERMRDILLDIVEYLEELEMEKLKKEEPKA